MSNYSNKSIFKKYRDHQPENKFSKAGIKTLIGVPGWCVFPNAPIWIFTAKFGLFPFIDLIRYPPPLSNFVYRWWEIYPWLDDFHIVRNVICTFLFIRVFLRRCFSKHVFRVPLASAFTPPIQFSTESYEMVEACILAKFELIRYLQIFAILA